MVTNGENIYYVLIQNIEFFMNTFLSLNVRDSHSVTARARDVSHFGQNRQQFALDMTA
jgi:hypothetical protein